MSWLKDTIFGAPNNNQNANRHPLRDVIHTDLAMFWGSPTCPICSTYNRRVYSISGKDRRFPPLSSLPNALHDGKCDLCGKYYGLSSYYEGVSKPETKTAIQISNMPIIDKRTPEQKQWFYEEQTNPKKKKKKRKGGIKCIVTTSKSCTYSLTRLLSICVSREQTMFC